MYGLRRRLAERDQYNKEQNKENKLLKINPLKEWGTGVSPLVQRMVNL